MQILADIVDLVHGATMFIIFTIVIMTMIMSMFLYKVLHQDGFFSNYNRNL